MREFVELLWRLSELERRYAQSFRHGTVHAVDAARGRMRLRIGGTEAEPFLSPWVPYAQTAGALKVHTPPSVGQQMTLIAPSGDYQQAVALPMTWSDQNAAPSQNGAENVITYGGFRIVLDANKVEITKGAMRWTLTAETVVGRIGATDLELSDRQARIRHGEVRAFVNANNAALRAGQSYVYVEPGAPPKWHADAIVGTPPMEHT